MSRIITDTDYKEYAAAVDRWKSKLFHPPGGDAEVDVLHAIVGIATEAGELLDPLKKAMFYGKDVDVVNLDEEVGDLLWYMVLYCNARRITLADLMEQNYAKLLKRFGNEFSQDKALNRNLEAEREVLEQHEQDRQR